MTTWQLLTSTWDWEPTVVVGCADLLCGYCLLARPLTGRAWLFVSGVLVLLFALVSPLDTLGDYYLFSAHMAQHLLLILVVPPLLLLGVPPRCWQQVLDWEPARRVERMVGRPPQSWLLGMGTLWVWHLPSLYDAAVYHPLIHVGQHLCFLVTSTIFWWPILNPLESRRLSLPAAMIYLLSASVAGSILGVLITFAPPGLYPAYRHPIDPLGALSLIRGGWRVSYALDQQLGGLLMWVTGGPFYLLWSLWMFIRFLHEADAPDTALQGDALTAIRLLDS